MFIAKRYLETRFKRAFKKGEIVPDEIAKYYKRDVKEEVGELLIDDSSEIETKVEDLEDLEDPEDLLEKFETKEDLEDFARAQGIELDRRKSMKNMVKDFFKFR